MNIESVQKSHRASVGLLQGALSRWAVGVSSRMSHSARKQSSPGPLGLNNREVAEIGAPECLRALPQRYSCEDCAAPARAESGAAPAVSAPVLNETQINLRPGTDLNQFASCPIAAGRRPADQISRANFTKRLNNLVAIWTRRPRFRPRCAAAARCTVALDRTHEISYR
ncbi:hypothetical protein EVAR_18013_1 [Eumeta japonica]|uniref:Uncharacterized protein n=1 Tax=Eumeta variegata TaxID=151549 RepID=A0A4C1Y6W8_EUMVA|nr:hypothetical protein EVAR_18013_1 [Eumeta japonica]